MTAALERTNGHKVDVDALYREQRHRLVGYAAKAVPNRELAEDAVHEAFVGLLAKERDAKNPAAYLATSARHAAIHEARDRDRQSPAGEVVERAVDDSGSRSSGVDACMGDPRVAAKVEEALAQLPEREGAAIRGHLLEGRKVSEVAQRLSLDARAVYRLINAGLTKLREAGYALPDLDDEPAPGGKKLSAVEQAAEKLRADFGDTPPADLPGMSVLAKRYGWNNKKTSAARMAYTGAPQHVRSTKKPATKTTPPTVKQLADALTKAVGSERLGVDGAEKILRKAFGQCSRNRAIEAKDMHNDRHGHARRVWPGGRRADEVKASAPKDPRPARTAASTPVVTPLVAEAWLSTSGEQVTCMFVNSDESTTQHPAVFRSMPGAQREITGHLVGQGYRPTGDWTEHGADESSRTFTNTKP